MPVFTTQLGQLNYTNTPEAIRAMANHIRYIQEQLEYTLMNLDSSNVTELNTDETNITSNSGGTNLSGSFISLKGSKGETFEAGLDEKGAFQFKLTDKNGGQILYLNSSGELVITSKAVIAIDCGEW